MIEYELCPQTKLLEVRPQGAFSVEDFKQLKKAVESEKDNQGLLEGLMVVSEGFPGFKNFAAMIEYFRFIKNQHHNIYKIALVTNSLSAELAELFGKHFVDAEIKHFLLDEEEVAKYWILGSSPV
jgi:hypothetical protein